MGKRSSFLRIARDAYDTSPAALSPLLRWLPPRTRYIEPCVGAGALAGHLRAAGHVCVAAYDLPIDAWTARYPLEGADAFITTPLWGRPGLHEIIVNLSDQAPTWLLLSADWPHNVGSAELVRRRLQMIVSIRRVRWIPGSEHVGKDNGIWCRFGASSPDNVTTFIRRDPRSLQSGMLPVWSAPKRVLRDPSPQYRAE
jgi:hypothetical protein